MSKAKTRERPEQPKDIFEKYIVDNHRVCDNCFRLRRYKYFFSYRYWQDHSNPLLTDANAFHSRGAFCEKCGTRRGVQMREMFGEPESVEVLKDHAREVARSLNRIALLRVDMDDDRFDLEPDELAQIAASKKYEGRSDREQILSEATSEALER